MEGCTMANKNLPPHVDKDIAERERNFDRQKDIVYWLVFEPRPGVTVAEEARVFWRVHIRGNPDSDPRCIDDAISAFQENLDLRKWDEAAVRYYVESDYAP
jgi:hypothetical protein